VRLRFSLALCVVLAAPASARADPVKAETRSVVLDPDDESRIYSGTNVGLLVSEDGGASFSWVCSAAIGYDGHAYSPDYAVHDGALYATSYDGISISRNGARTFSTATVWPRPRIRGGTRYRLPLTDLFYSALVVGRDGRIWIGSATGGAIDDVFISDDGDEFFPAGGGLKTSDPWDPNAWWRSITVAESDPRRIYIEGLLTAGMAGEPQKPLLYRSDDGGNSWIELGVDGIKLGAGPTLELKGTSPTDKDVVYLRSIQALDPIGDIVYRSGDGGATWQEVFRAKTALDAFAVADGGESILIGGTGSCDGSEDASGAGCAALSTSGGTPGSFEKLADAPRLACATTDHDGSFLVCADDRADGFALARWRTGEDWTPVLHMRDLIGPLDAPEGSVQASCGEDWAMLCVSFGLCNVEVGQDAGLAGPDPERPGCFDCTSGSGAVPPLAETALVIGVLLWTSRRRSWAVKRSPGD